MVAGKFQGFVDTMHINLPDNILRDTVLNSVKGLLKKRLTDQMLHETCWRVAGNLESLLDQKPVPVWTRQTKFEWIPAEVCEVQTVRRYHSLTHRLVFQSLAGSIVPRRVVQHWSFRKTSYLATFRDEHNHGFGFGRHKLNRRGEQLGHCLYYDVRQFYGLRCLLLLDPERSKLDPEATEVGHTGSLVHHNRELIRLRDRQETPCVKGLPDTQECFACPYGTDICPNATHPTTNKRGSCPRCGAKGFFDTDEEDHPGICINCVFQERRA